MRKKTQLRTVHPVSQLHRTEERSDCEDGETLELDVGEVPTVDVLGASVHLIDRLTLSRYVERWAVDRVRTVIGNHNLHSLHLLRRGMIPAQFYDLATVTHIDGMGLVALGRLLSLPTRPNHVITYLDWFPELLSMAAASDLRVFYLGGRPGVAEDGLRRLSSRSRRFDYSCESGYFDSSAKSLDSARVLGQIQAFDPHLLFVGMGMPRQELWIIQNVENLPPSVIFNCGACIDYFAGVQRPQPAWMRSRGFAWLHRLLHDPRRMWRRYLTEPFFLVGPLMRELISGRRRQI